MFFYLASFVLLLGPLVFVHEFGHFIFAKLFNVRVDTFSMGFGPKIFKKTWGETEYCLSAVPLGGYVKLYGQDPTEAIEAGMRHRALNNLDAWKRFLVFIAGPLFNFLFAIVVFAVMMMVGEHHVLPILARVNPGTQAYITGFRSGDLVTAVDREVVTKLDDVMNLISASPNKQLTLRVKRPLEGGKFELKEFKVTPQPAPGLSIYGESVEVGEIDGLLRAGRYTTIGVSDPESAAGKAGLKTGDEIVTFNGVPVKSWEMLETLFQKAKGRGGKLTFGVVRHELSYWTPESMPQPASKASEEVSLGAASTLEQMGIRSSEMFVSSLVHGSPAQTAGLQPGDLLVALDGSPLSSFQDLRDKVQKAGESAGAFELTVERAGKRVKSSITPNVNLAKDAVGNEVKQFMIGVYPFFVQSEPETFVERVFNPFTLTVDAWTRALDLSGKTLVSIKKLFFRQVSVGTLGGPILIGKLAGDSMSRGISSFLKVMALISISLAIFNILPVPILDGGHIFLLLVEIVRGKPISIRQTEVVQQVGLSIIVLLLVVVLFNDISRVGLPALRNMFQ